MINRPTNKGPLFYRGDPRSFIRELPGIGSKLLPRVIEDLGNGDPAEALLEIERNPYQLTEVDGIGFKKADKIAKQTFDLTDDDARRHEAGNRYILEQKGVLGEREFTGERIKLELRDADHIGSGVEIEDGLYWLPEELAAEKGLEAWLRGVRTGEPVLTDLSESEQAVCQRLGLDDIQERGVRALLGGQQVVALTGGAGCGKTHVIATAAQVADLRGLMVQGMAFAGKAADRMREAFEKYGVMAEASTIHKALGYQKKAFTAGVLAADLVVIDEASMLPNWLLWAVVKRLKPGATLVLVGDPNQLPPIGYGTPFVDAIKYSVPRVHLERNYRQADQQGILHVAEGILNRKRPAPADCVDFHLGVAEGNLVALFKDLVRQHGGQDFDGWQCITYQNENAERYNLAAQEIINPHGDPLFEYPLWKLGTEPGSNRPKYRAEVRQGDKVIVVKNSTLLGIFNGQTGAVVGQDYRAKLVQRKQPDGTFETERGDEMMHLLVRIGKNVEPTAIPEDELEKYIQPGYVITVHKAQGSDWDRVIVMQPGDVRNDTARRFFYTAVTRAKTRLVIVSMNTVVKWWTNAAADAPDVPSSLIRRLERPAAEEIIWCKGCSIVEAEFEDDLCANCFEKLENGEPFYDPEPDSEVDALLNELGLTRPLLESEWRDLQAAIAEQEASVTPDAVPGTVQSVVVVAPTNWRARAQQVTARHMTVQQVDTETMQALEEDEAQYQRDFARQEELERVRREFAEMEVA